MNQNEVRRTGRERWSAAYRAAAKRHEEATKPKPDEPAPRYSQTDYSINPPASAQVLSKEEYAVRKELARDYREIADAIERAAAEDAG